MKLAEASQQISKNIDIVKGYAQGSDLWRDEIQNIVERCDQDQEFQDAMDDLNRIQRIMSVFASETFDREDVFEAYLDQEQNFRLFSQLHDVPGFTSLQENLGHMLYDADPNQGNAIIFRLGDYSREVIGVAIKRAIKDGHNFDVAFDDYLFDVYLKSEITPAQAISYAKANVERHAFCNRIITSRPGSQEPHSYTVPNEVTEAYKDGGIALRQRVSEGLFYTLTAIPAERDAITDGYCYEEYLQLFFEMCDQPWVQIDKAHKALIERFNQANDVHITNSDGTDISMSVEGFTFVNSLTAKNIPGSEIFSAPVKQSLNGTIVAKGGFFSPSYPSNIIRDITLVFENGRIVDFDAVEGHKYLKKSIETDEGSQHIGELGIGTNPHLKRHVANGLLVEKIGGSFHVALGRSYKYTEYLGVPVIVDNDNHSDIHWDVTTMLFGKEGVIELDGTRIMEDGLFIGEEFDVLNRGWKAVPFNKRPEYWQKKYPGE